MKQNASQKSFLKMIKSKGAASFIKWKLSIKLGQLFSSMRNNNNKQIVPDTGTLDYSTLLERSRAVDFAGLFRCIIQVQKAGAISILKASMGSSACSCVRGGLLMCAFPAPKLGMLPPTRLRSGAVDEVANNSRI